MGTGIIIATIALSIGSFMNVLDSTIVNVSLSHIAGDFAIAPSQGTWVITSYAVSEAIFLVLIGWLTKRLGIVRQYIGATVLFTFASILCGIAPTFEFLLCARVFQGVVGASMIPLSQTLMLSIYPKEKKSLAMGIWSMTVIVAPILGPIIGGWITDQLSWRWCFYINLPFGIFSSAIVYKLFKQRMKEEKIEKVPIDMIGLLFLTLGVGSLQLLLDKGNDLDWFSSSFIIILTIISIISLICLVIWEWNHKNPVVKIRLYGNRNFLVASICLFISLSIYFSSVVTIPMWLQNFMGYNSTQSGLTVAASGVAILMVTPFLGIYLPKLDSRKVIALGFFIFSLVSIFGANYNSEITQGYISRNRFFSGFGLGLFFMPLSLLALSEVADSDIASASGLFNFVKNLGNSVATSLSVNYWNDRQAINHQSIIESVNTGNTNFLQWMDMLSGSTVEKLETLDRIIGNQAAIMGINDMMVLSGVGMLILIPVVFLAKKPKGATHFEL
ncbi:MAG: DHA2 family efflux MFS transporter permease subunit [Fusobacteriaceae bacterium]